ncbi:hypothetical protein LR48_Vigan11g032800 [Vigna angularis]|uniref:Uncharacterized protein n=1 Tax=Phaseolus angularis TaxID=3914 RepID=A0A0L9VQE5_PHAAN|nr:hypothetical protein LR48_Vigan11g032800 [Vigna angularis]
MSLMNPRTEKLVRRLTIVATVTASYFLLTADYGPQPNALDPGGTNECRTSLFYCVQFYLICSSKAIYYDKNSLKKHKSNTALCPPEIVSGNKNMAQYLVCYCIGFTVTTPKIKKQILSAQSMVKGYILGSKIESQENQLGKLDSNKDQP